VVSVDIAVVYESMFGNTRAIAESIGDGLREADPGGRVTVVPVGGATPSTIADADLLVVGGPTHVLRMTSRRSRTMGLNSVEKAAGTGSAHPDVQPGAAGPGVREWLDALPKAPPGRRAVAFDTRLPSPFAGGAARSIARRLRRHGYRVIAKPCGFVVQDAQGPLKAGELDRARSWAAGLVGQPVH
jgi:hypothetical protein